VTRISFAIRPCTTIQHRRPELVAGVCCDVPANGVAAGVSLANNGGLYAFEGPNEPNNFGFNYSVTGHDCGLNGTFLGCAEYQRDLYAAVRADSTATNYPVFNISESGAEFDNVGFSARS
jgi:hypothetical protein